MQVVPARSILFAAPIGWAALAIATVVVASLHASGAREGGAAMDPLGFGGREDPELKERVALYDRILFGLAAAGARPSPLALSCSRSSGRPALPRLCDRRSQWPWQPAD
ncbi:hypothetical protein [Chelatococcus reniformis]|uniref:Uncharacterized protein n=1 Tax=Chelatococcus reniformis TaxID=1494448 RepID=A0A916U143_9HYPH|nr:hypothetical protein [Chelatococcus reniformis]GGC56437.1 hypothetical protein GCM10010994_14190 [Chelatococcus reniformis]